MYFFLDSVDAIIKNLEDQVPGCLTSGLTVEEYLLWAVDNPLTSLFQQLIFQVSKPLTHCLLLNENLLGLPCCAGSETNISTRGAGSCDGVAAPRGEEGFHPRSSLVLDIIRLVGCLARLRLKFFDQRRISA